MKRFISIFIGVILVNGFILPGFSNENSRFSISTSNILGSQPISYVEARLGATPPPIATVVPNQTPKSFPSGSFMSSSAMGAMAGTEVGLRSAISPEAPTLLAQRYMDDEKLFLENFHDLLEVNVDSGSLYLDHSKGISIFGVLDDNEDGKLSIEEIQANANDAGVPSAQGIALALLGNNNKYFDMLKSCFDGDENTIARRELHSYAYHNYYLKNNWNGTWTPRNPGMTSSLSPDTEGSPYPIHELDPRLRKLIDFFGPQSNPNLAYRNTEYTADFFKGITIGYNSLNEKEKSFLEQIGLKIYLSNGYKLDNGEGPRGRYWNKRLELAEMNGKIDEIPIIMTHEVGHFIDILKGITSSKDSSNPWKIAWATDLAAAESGGYYGGGERYYFNPDYPQELEAFACLFSKMHGHIATDHLKVDVLPNLEAWYSNEYHKFFP